MMKTTCLFTILLLAVVGCTESRESLLEKTLANVENVKFAAYYERARSWAPGDSLYQETLWYQKEYDNPADTTIGASFLTWHAADTTALYSCYDGRVLMYLDHENRRVSLDDFSSRSLPFRPVSAPFFNYTRSILRYLLTTTDSIDVQWLDDSPDSHHLRLTIHEDRQIEFFGHAQRMPENPFMPLDPTSTYDLWIGKSDNLPRKVKRQMAHDISEDSCMLVQLNEEEASAIHAETYIPSGYEVHYRGEQGLVPSTHPLLGKPAPAWSLTDAWGKPYSLSDTESRVVVMNFTGIGCGPCYAAIPFLNALPDRFSPGDCEVVSVECWGHKPHSLRVYADKNKLKYRFFVGSDAIIQDYLGGKRGVPVFVILDDRRIVRKVLIGYNPDSQGRDILQAVSEVLGK